MYSPVRKEKACYYTKFFLSILHTYKIKVCLLLGVGRVTQPVKRLSYGLDGPGSNHGGDETFRPSRQAMGPTQPSVK